MSDRKTASEIKVRAAREFMSDSLSIYVKDGRYHCVDVVMQEKAPAEYVPPAMTISANAAQTLMDDLWAAGIRPTEGAGSAGALAATQKHLEDMRTLVFKKNGGASE